MAKGKTKGSFEYGTEAEDMILQAVDFNPKTTNAITNDVKKNYFSKIHAMTVKRLLLNLAERGKIKKFKIGKTIAWQR